MKAGLLLPRSTTHPLITHNFLDGLNSFLRHHHLHKEITYVSGAIGFGTDTALIEKEADRLLIEHQVDLIVIFADYPVVKCLFPILKALNKLLIVVNHAAKYPPSWQAEPNVIHHSLNNALNCWLTGKKAAKETTAAAVVSSFYDGGYSINHALFQSFLNNDGEIVFNFVGHQYKDQFNTQPLVSFLKQAPDTNSLLAILSGELVPELYLQLKEHLTDRKLKVYASPVLLEESTLAEQQSTQICLAGYTSWFAELADSQNSVFCERFKTDTLRQPDSFAVLGWDTGLLLHTIFEISVDQPINARTITQHHLLQNLHGAKGKMQLHPFTQQYISPVHYLSDDLEGNVIIEHTLPLEEVMQAFDELITQEVTGFSSEWLNTYLCS